MPLFGYSSPKALLPARLELTRGPREPVGEQGEKPRGRRIETIKTKMRVTIWRRESKTITVTVPGSYGAEGLARRVIDIAEGRNPGWTVSAFCEVKRKEKKDVNL